LGVNIDHIATLRQLRGTPYPDLLQAARLAVGGGADQVTVHLREDRRHIQDSDVKLLRAKLSVPLNLEMAISPAMLQVAARIRPDWACLVPEKRQELTTEGGLDVMKNPKRLARAIEKLHRAGIRVSCFVEPHLPTVRLCRELGADAVELHTGQFCLATQVSVPAAPQKAKMKAQKKVDAELLRIKKAADLGVECGIHVHAGHGFDYLNVREVAQWRLPNGAPLIEEYNIGHAIVCRAVLVGLERAVREMVSSIQAP
jgi:pyridoxine 5-phosphate synthase